MLCSRWLRGALGPQGTHLPSARLGLSHPLSLAWSQGAHPVSLSSRPGWWECKVQLGPQPPPHPPPPATAGLDTPRGWALGWDPSGWWAPAMNLCVQCLLESHLKGKAGKCPGGQKAVGGIWGMLLCGPCLPDFSYRSLPPMHTGLLPHWPGGEAWKWKSRDSSF